MDADAIFIPFMPNKNRPLKTEKAPFLMLAKTIDKKNCCKDTDRDANCYLNHTQTDVPNTAARAIQTGGRGANGGVASHICHKLVCGYKTINETALGC